MDQFRKFDAHTGELINPDNRPGAAGEPNRFAVSLSSIPPFFLPDFILIDPSGSFSLRQPKRYSHSIRLLLLPNPRPSRLHPLRYSVRQIPSHLLHLLRHPTLLLPLYLRSLLAVHWRKERKPVLLVVRVVHHLSGRQRRRRRQLGRRFSQRRHRRRNQWSYSVGKVVHRLLAVG